MTPFLQFRVWAREGPTAERLSAAFAALLAVVVLGWAVVPLATDDAAQVATSPGFEASDSAGTFDDLTSSTTTPADGAEGGDTSSATPGSTPSEGDADPGDTGSGAGIDGSPAATQPGTGPAGACANLRATDQGVTADEIFVAVPVINLGGSVGNETFGIRGDLEDVAKAAAAGVNATGGAACRKLRIKVYQVNALDQNEARAKCLEIIADKPFAVIDFGAYLGSTLRKCFVDAGLPMQVALAITEAEANGSFPYMYGLSASADRQLRSWVFDAADRGMFRRSGFKKLGVIIDDCEPGIVDKLVADLASVGVTADKLSLFKVSCESSGSADQLFQAVLQHQRDDASHVFLAIAQLAATQYVQAADGVDYRPVYSGSDYGAVTSTTSEGNWSNGFDGSIAITSTRGGELNSGIAHSLLPQCRKWYTDADVPPPEEDGDSALFFCSFFRLFQAAANANGPNLKRDRFLIDGLARVGRFESVAFTDVIFDRPGKVTGGDTIRSIKWQSGCRCFKVETVPLRPAR